MLVTNLRARAGAGATVMPPRGTRCAARSRCLTPAVRCARCQRCASRRLVLTARADSARCQRARFHGALTAARKQVAHVSSGGKRSWLLRVVATVRMVSESASRDMATAGSARGTCGI